MSEINRPDDTWIYTILEKAAKMPNTCKHPYVNFHVMYHAPWKTPLFGKTVKGAIRVKTLGPYLRGGTTKRSAIFRVREELYERVITANRDKISPADF